ncbi:hypothetical protein V8B97DRAFT_348878 [Scleroderma yunnanense]
MTGFALSTLFAIAIASKALAQPDPADPTPLTDKHYAYPTGIPYQIDYNTAAIRGPQYGYNICNSTTQNQNSDCQTIMVNGIDDFCLWAPPQPNSTIGDTEAIEVGWCSKSGWGTRLIPAGTLTGVQVLKTSKYIQFAGFINQVNLNLALGDYGGELDPHGADLRGNPLGALVYSNAFSGGGTNYSQVNDWNSFIGGDIFCFTICDPSSSAADQSAYCQNIYDEIGCTYNMPNNAQNGTFEVCDADLKTPVGIYVTNGVTMTYTQPYTGPVNPPYTPIVPQSSNCVTYQSTQLYSNLPTPTTAPSSSSSHSGSAAATGSKSSSGSSPTSTSNGATAVGVSSMAGILGTLFAVAFLS